MTIKGNRKETFFSAPPPPPELKGLLELFSRRLENSYHEEIFYKPSNEESVYLNSLRFFVFSPNQNKVPGPADLSMH